MSVKNRRTLKHLIGIMASIAAMSWGTANACNGVLDNTTNAEGTHNGFYYNFWRQSADSNVQIGCGDGGNFSASWSNVFNWRGGKGWNPGGPLVVGYSGTFLSSENQGSQHANLMLHGWTHDPVIEYHVVESYGQHNPSSCDEDSGLSTGSFQSDGATYDLSYCLYVSLGESYLRYFSVRNPPLPWGEVSGTITVANHFEQWAKEGMDLGTHDYMMLAVDAYDVDSDSAGSFNLTVIDGPLEPLPPQCGTLGGVPICCSIISDPDGDGMGEENGEVCTVTPATQSAHENNPPDVLAAFNVGGINDAIERNGIWYEPAAYVSGGRLKITQDYVSGAHGNAIFKSALSGDVRFSIPITNQQVSVELSFVEFTHSTPGARAFDVTIENQRVLQNVDVFAEMGHDTVWTPAPFVVDVTDGTLNINLYASVDSGTLSAILVRKSENSSEEKAGGGTGACFLLIMASGFLVLVLRFLRVKNN